MRTAVLLGLLLPLLIAGEATTPPRDIPGLKGHITIPLTMPVDGVATIVLATPQGRQLRTLMQAVPLTAGRYVARWDGLDGWGDLVPAGTAVQANVISGRAPTAHYEFAIASPNPIPWPTKPFGEGAAQRTGGWLGDHGVSAAVVAVGEQLYVGSTMAEHGHTIAICDLDGVKRWGRGGLDGWKGPRLLASDGTRVYGVVENQLFRFERDGSEVQKIADTKSDKIVGLAAHAGRVALTVVNQEVAGALLLPTVGTGDFDVAACVPKPSTDKAYNRNLTGAEQFATTFHRGGHPQTGIAPAVGTDGAGIIAAFKKPVALGSLLIARPAPGITVEAWVFAGDKYATTQAPVPGAAAGAGWELLGRSDPAVLQSLISAPRAGMTVTALYLRLTSATPIASAKQWPRVEMCRIFARRLERVAEPVRVVVPAGITNQADVASGWRFTAGAPLTSAAPVALLVDVGGVRSFDALSLLNCRHRSLEIDAWTGQGKPDLAAASGWMNIAEITAGSSRIYGNDHATPATTDTRVSLRRAVSTSALRLRLTGGMGSGRYTTPAWTADAALAETADLALLRLRDPRPDQGGMILEIRNGESGAVERRTRHPSSEASHLAWAGDGTLYTIVGTRLCRSVVPTTDDGELRHQVLNGDLLRNPTSLAVSPDGKRIAVGDDDLNQILLFDPAGSPVGRIGTGSPRRAGAWDARTVDRPCALSFDVRGRLWVCENTYTPKRLTCYNSDGSVVRELLGPPHYGGGGWLDPSLKSFIYEACEYEVDFAAGTTRLRRLLDVQDDPRTPTADPASYTYTKVGRPVHIDGRRYLVGDAGEQQNGDHYIICLLDPGADRWRPVAVMGKAQDAVFLTREDKPWSAHWLAQDLSASTYIWCDVNGDGDYQIDEVQLFKNQTVMGNDDYPFSAPYFGSINGPDLTFWGSRARLAPSRFTARGVPIFESQRIQPFDYAKLAPVTMSNIIANQAAKGGYGGFTLVTRDGSLISEGQPYVVGPDLAIRGGPPTRNPSAKPNAYQPAILGTVLDNSLSFVGSAQTTSPVGEVAMLNGNNGRWFLWSAHHACVIGEIFTGKSGSFAGITTVTRGMDVTGYKHDWETFFGHFVRADNGRCYAIAGRGHHGVFRIDGLDRMTVATTPVTVTTDQQTANARLQSAAEVAATQLKQRGERKLDVRPLASAAPGFVLDGNLREWGEIAKFARIGDGDTQGFAAAWTPTHLHLAYRGSSGLGNHNVDWKYQFKSGFAVDVMMRTDPAAKGREVQRGDRRVVLARHQGAWVAVLYDYVTGVEGGEALTFSSPVTSTHVERVVRLPADAVTVALVEGADKGGGKKDWTLEATIAWTALGISPKAGLKLVGDIGILSPDSGGIQVDARTYWSDPDTRHVADLAVEAEIHPANWGTFTLVGK